MGYLTDNFGKTRLGKRFGRRRFFLLIGIPLMMFYPLLNEASISVRPQKVV